MGDLADQWHELDALRLRLDHHPVYGALRCLDDLRCFMQHHLYSVWDFMSLVKTLQAAIAPVRVPWVPVGDPAVRRFVNQLVLEEESDLAGPVDDGAHFLSHFELYCAAMREVGADPQPGLAFIGRVVRDGIAAAIDDPALPPPSRAFMRTTFNLIDLDRPHLAAAALALGREHIIPTMFRSFLRDMGIDAAHAPMFHFYLQRHIHLDEDLHAPLSSRLLDHLCGGDPERIAQARVAARTALTARLAFWDGVAEAIARRASARPTAPGARGGAQTLRERASLGDRA